MMRQPAADAPFSLAGGCDPVVGSVGTGSDKHSPQKAPPKSSVEMSKTRRAGTSRFVPRGVATRHRQAATPDILV